MLKSTTNIRFVIFAFLWVYSNFSFGQVDWKLTKTDGNIQLWVKNVENTGLKQFKLQTIFNKNIKSVYRLIRDVENMHLWYDKVQEVKLIKKINDSEAVYLLTYDLPFPFEDRISTVKGMINYDETERKIIVHTDYFPYDLPKDQYNLPKITKLKSSWEIFEADNGGIHITHTGYMDPGGNIPIWLVNEGVTSGPLKTIKSMKKILDKY